MIRLLLLLRGIRSTLTLGDPLNECCPQCPVLNIPAQLLRTHAYVFLYGINPAHAWFSIFPAPFYFSQHYCLFQKLLSSHEVPKVGQPQFIIFASSNSSVLNCSRTHLFSFLEVQGVCRAVLQHHISNESVFLLSVFFTAQISHLYVIIGSMRVWIILALVSKDTSLHLMAFPNSFIAALVSLCLLLISWLQSPFKLMTEPR